MSDLRVNRVISLDGSSTVEFVTGVSGNAEGLRFPPKILQYSPTPLSTDISVTTNQFNITFDQPIQFSGVGTIYIRQGSASGTVYESFTCGVSAGATIAGDTLQINTSAGNFSYFTNYVITLPSVGIANTYGQYYAGGQGYTFRTGVTVFDVQGGDFEQVLVAPTSPTGYYKYNIFTSSGIATFTGPSASATDFAYVLVGGGGGGGGQGGPGNYVPGNGGAGGGGGAGGHIYNYNSNNLPAGVYTVTIGSGGSGTYDNPTGTVATPNPSSPTGLNEPRSPSYPPSSTYPVSQYPVIVTAGQNSSFGPTPVGNIIAYGGGKAGTIARRHPSPSYPGVDYQPAASLYGTPGGSGGGNTQWHTDTPGISPSPVSPIPGGSGVAYPGPNQQGYPGGSSTFNPGYGQPSPAWPTKSNYAGGSGGGGAGGAGGSGGAAPQPSPYSTTIGDGGSGKATSAFPGPGLTVISGFPVTLATVMGPTGLLAGGGGGGYKSIYYNNNSASNAGLGGPGGGGRGSYYAPPTLPGFPTNGPSERGRANTGGGGGGGEAPGQAEPGSPYYAVPAPGSWFGQNGGSGVMMIRYAHPGA